MTDTGQRMSDAEYLAAQTYILAIGVAIAASPVNFDAFVERIDHSKATGAVIDPTLYRAAMVRLGSIRNVAEAMKLVKMAALNLEGLVASETARATVTVEVHNG